MVIYLKAYLYVYSYSICRYDGGGIPVGNPGRCRRSPDSPAVVTYNECSWRPRIQFCSRLLAISPPPGNQWHWVCDHTSIDTLVMLLLFM